MRLSKAEQDKNIDEVYQKIKNKKSVIMNKNLLFNPKGSETEIMSALRYRDGDKFGF